MMWGATIFISFTFAAGSSPPAVERASGSVSHPLILAAGPSQPKTPDSQPVGRMLWAICAPRPRARKLVGQALSLVEIDK